MKRKKQHIILVDEKTLQSIKKYATEKELPTKYAIKKIMEEYTTLHNDQLLVLLKALFKGKEQIIDEAYSQGLLWEMFTAGMEDIKIRENIKNIRERGYR